MATLLDGRKIAAKITSEVELEVQTLAAIGVRPALVSVQVGANPASEIYVRRQERACTRQGISFRTEVLAVETSERQLLRTLQRLNQDSATTGILLQLPLPTHINPRTARRCMSPEKDVEGVHPENLGFLVAGPPALVPCTAASSLECLLESGIGLEGRNACVVGHSETVGRPLSLLLMERLCTVTICHHRTMDLRLHLRDADFVVVAVGRPGLITGDMIKAGAVVVDVGINEVQREGRTEVVGDVEASSVSERAAFLTPVPGGVGPVTVAMLLRNIARAAARQDPL